ncbi:hypothetical protein ABZW18_28640 [Streptomyces sp. NPDC004647]|uniref:hypothetical protein n=1 Tax=Streptomyces sp. NPDC004647 TaxID=3154671 RepID=UPI0033B55554
MPSPRVTGRAAGEHGEQGERGPAGQSCEDGYSRQTPSYDPDARIAEATAQPHPEPEPSSGGGRLSLGFTPRRDW